MRPVFRDIQFSNGVLNWSLDVSWAYVRIKIYDSGNHLVLYPIKDKIHEAKYPTQFQTDFSGLIEGASYTAKLFGWCSDGRNSDIVQYPFVYHGPAVLSPNGGEEWNSASIHDIIWNFPSVPGNVMLQYSTDGGANWTMIATSTPNDGNFPWVLPPFAVTEHNCKVKVSDASDGLPWDVSDSVFTIYVCPDSVPPASSLVGFPSGPDCITLEWGAPSEDIGFTIYCDGCLCGSVPPFSPHAYTDSDLRVNHSYLYWIKGIDGWCESIPSNADTVFLGSKLLFPSSSNNYPVDQNLTDLTSLPNPDTADVEILYTSAYPSHHGEVEVRLKNPMIICGFNFLIKFSNLDLIDFHTGKISKDSILIGSNWVHYPVRECLIDTVGSLISQRGFNLLASRGQVGDTTLPDCKYLWVKAWAKDSLITPWPNYRTLFKFVVDAHCIPDSATDRTAYFYPTFGRLYSSYGDDPFRYHLGGLTVWWSVPGDANADSLVNLGDVTFLISYVYKNGHPPCIPEAGDANGDCAVNLGDVVFLIAYLYKGGPPPVPGCWHGKD